MVVYNKNQPSRLNGDKTTPRFCCLLCYKWWCCSFNKNTRLISILVHSFIRKSYQITFWDPEVAIVGVPIFKNWSYHILHGYSCHCIYTGGYRTEIIPVVKGMVSKRKALYIRIYSTKICWMQKAKMLKIWSRLND